MEITEIKQKIQSLIDKAVSENEGQKKTLNFLFRKLDEIKELETIDRLRRHAGGAKYLQAYLLYKSIARSNYQLELTQHSDYETDDGQDKLLNAISADVEQFEKDKEKRERLPAEQPTNEQLLTMLGERIGTGEIKRELTDFGNFLMTDLLKVDLYNGKLTPDPAEEFLKRHKYLESQFKGRDDCGCGQKEKCDLPAFLEYKRKLKK